ncbi:MAG: hypothetical protein EZS28_018054, partial [Streblomastix strix]
KEDEKKEKGNYEEDIEILISDKEGLVIQDIRNHSIRSLGWIQYHGDNDAQSQLCKLGYAGMMAVSIGMCGGCNVNNDWDIKSALSSIGCFFNRIHKGRKNYYEDIDDYISSSQIPILFIHSEEQFEEEGGNDDYVSISPQPELAKHSEEQFEEECGNDDYVSISPQPELAKSSEEQFEEEGGNEEIEACLVNYRKEMHIKSIKDEAIGAKFTILNFYCDEWNEQQRRYEGYQYDEEDNSVLEYNGFVDDENQNDEDQNNDEDQDNVSEFSINI